MAGDMSGFETSQFLRAGRERDSHVDEGLRVNKKPPLRKAATVPEHQNERRQIGKQPTVAGSAVANTPRRGRPPGKRSNPEFEQVTIYIRKKTHQRAKIELLKSEKRREFSELIEELVTDWLPD